MGNNGRIAKNTILLYIRMLFFIAISLYTSRVVLQNLGISDYGLYNVVCSVAVSFSFLSNAMNTSVQRYLTVAIGKGDEELLCKVFNIARVIHFALGIAIVFACEIFGLWFIYNQMTIPDGRWYAVFWSFQLSLLSTFFSLISVPFNALIISREKMGAFAYISILDISIKLFIAYVISIIEFDRLITYALLIAISHILTRFVYWFYCKKHFVESRFEYYKVDGLYKEMTIFASWGVFGHLSTVFTTSVQDMMINAFFTPVINAARGVAMRVSGTINMFNNNFQMAVTPQIVKSFTVGDKRRTFTLIYNSSRFSIYLMWLLTLPVMLCMDDLLSLWLVEVPILTNVFLSLILIYGIIKSVGNPLLMALRANGDIKKPSITAGFFQLLNLPLAFIALKSGLGAESVFVIMIICGIFVHMTRIYYAYKYMSMPIADYCNTVFLRPFGVLLVSSLVPVLVSSLLQTNNRFLFIVIVSFTSIFSVLLAVTLFGVSNSERSYLLTVVKRRMKI